MKSLFLQYLKEMQNKGCLTFYEEHSLSLVSTFAIGGKARFFIMPHDEQTLIRTVSMARKAGRYEVIGNASNLLFDDRGFSGSIISTVKIKELSLIEKPSSPSEKRIFVREGDMGVIKASCGTMLPSLSEFCRKNSISGFSGLCSIPATVGGAICLNAGAYGGEISDELIAIEVYRPKSDEKLTLLVDRRDFSYRKSPICGSGDIVLSAYFAANSGDGTEISERIKKNKALRICTQPVGQKSAGSYFLRPNALEGKTEFCGKSAGEIIDMCGLKGMSVGEAMVSEKHAGFLVNTGRATAKDVRRLAEKVKRVVYKKSMVRLIEEVEFVPYHGGYRA